MVPKSVAVPIFCYLSKAFDCLRYEILGKKIEFCSFKNKKLHFIKLYLSKMTQYVNVESLLSDLMKIDIRVPQGLILVPLLFLIYVNDLPNALPS